MNEFDEVSYSVGVALKQLRKNAGYKSYEQFAFENKMSRIQYWKMENGNNFTLKSLLTILDIHQVEVTSFFVSLKKFSSITTDDSIRLNQIMDYVQLDKKAFGEKLGYKNSNILNHVLLGGKKISLPLARKIKKTFPTINLSWILKGEGSFLQSSNQGV